MNGRGWLYTGGVVFLATLGLAWATLPGGRVPTHWSTNNRVDGWMSRDVFLAVYLGLAVLIVGSMLSLVWYYSRSATLAGLSVPNADYWRRPENIDRARSLLAKWLNELSGVTLVFLAVVLVAIIIGARDPHHVLPGWTMPTVGVYCVVLVWLIIQLWRRFTPERNESDPSAGRR